jgi:enoyl-CoA hydratase
LSTVREVLTYSLADGIATITLDDGKANVMSPPMMTSVHEALDRALADEAVVLLRGRPGRFSGGFDLAVLRSGDFLPMVRGGMELCERVLAFPQPVVAEVTGHAVAMGLFLALSCDYRIGAEGEFKLVANEVAIGLTIPRAAIEVLRQRLTPAAFNRATVLAEVFTPANAVECGVLDRVVPAGSLQAEAATVAASYVALDRKAHAGTKRRVRLPALQAIRTGIVTDFDQGGWSD